MASVGIDRIDVEAATRAGVMIVNAPTGNTIAAAEHTMALMLALLRRVPDANASVQAGEWERSRYTGRELRGKTLGIIGLGKIGRAVARRVAGFEMRVLASDPYLTEEQASEAGAKLVGMAELLHRSDVITVHTPLTAQTRHLLGRATAGGDEAGGVRPQRRTRRDRRRVRPRRCAHVRPPRGRRGGRLFDGADGGRQPAARRPEPRADPAPRGLDSRGTGPGRPRDGRAGPDGARWRDAAVRVNAPSVSPETAPKLRPYVELGRRLAILARQLAPSAFDAISLTYAGEIAAGECGPIRTAAVAGILEAVTDQRVNAVNADLVAHDRGLTVRETRTASSEPWASLVELSIGPTDGEPVLTLAGSTAHGRPHLAGLDGFAIDAELAGIMLVTRHQDRPGIVGAVGTILADAGINISSLELSRLSERGDAMMFVSVDESIPPDVLEGLRAADGIVEARVVQLPD